MGRRRVSCCCVWLVFTSLQFAKVLRIFEHTDPWPKLANADCGYQQSYLRPPMSSPKKRILYQGLLASPASWARVGRGLLAALIELGADVQAISSRGFRFDPSFPLPEGLRVVSVGDALHDSEPDIGIGFLHPPYLDRLLGRCKYNLFAWEADRVPPGWIDQLRHGTVITLVPSQFTRQSLIDSGLEPERVAVLHYGFDARFVKPRCPPSQGPFTFLSVAAPHWRKGVRELCQAYRSAFTHQDEVLLHIKTTYDPADSRRRHPFEISSWQNLFAECGLSDASAPTVKLDLATLTDAQQMEIYQSAHVHVAATWGESFGLAILESLASGMPVIATGWSGHTEFVPFNADLVPYELRPGGDALYELAAGARVAVPDVPALAARMRWHFEHPAESAQQGRLGQAAVSHLTWQNAARGLLRLIDDC